MEALIESPTDANNVTTKFRGDEIMSTGPLAGIRVIDFTHILAGPFCTQLLADAGATVIKIEPPTGEWSRQRGPQREGSDGKVVSSYFAGVNRGKRGITLDLKNPAGLEYAHALISSADVVVENFSPGTMERLGLGLAALRQLDPKLITASISLFGGLESAGPLAERGGLAIVAEAESSLMSQHRGKDGKPITTPYGLGDMASGLSAYAAITTSLYERTATGVGKHIDIAMIRALLAFNAISITADQISAAGGVNAKPRATAAMGIFEASDGYVAIGVNSDSLFHRLTIAMGRPELAKDPRYAEHVSRDEKVEEVNEIVTGWTRSHTIDEVIAAIAPTGVPCGRVNTPSDILSNETSSQLRLFEELSDGVGTYIRTPANPFGFNFSRPELPSLGESNEQVTEEIFGSEEEYTRLLKLGAFGERTRIEGT
jgi:crotonobetainyl-CoA:carnitine CoA-transferase CaiB-like acyl-CoA transferase